MQVDVVGSSDCAPVQALDINHLVELIAAGLCGDFNVVRRISKLLVDSLPGNEAIHARQRLAELTRRLPRSATPAPVAVKPLTAAVEQAPLPSDPLFLEEKTSALLSRFLDEAKEMRRLQAAGLASRLFLMLSGPPGTGKTSAAGHIAARLGRRFNVVRLDAMISSRLGDTAKNLRQALDMARGHDGFLFIDEVDAIAKAREDVHEMGELKRVVNTFLQSLDALPPDAVVIAASNHPDLLDRAVWRRFPFQVELGLPSMRLRSEMWDHHLDLRGSLKQVVSALATISAEMSGSDIREIARSARRLSLLSDRPLDVTSIAEAVLESRGGRLSMPRRLADPERKDMRDRLAAEKDINATQRAALARVSQQSESARDARRKPVRTA